MYNQKRYNLFSNKKEDEEKNKLKIKDIVISKINIFLNYMIDLQCKYNFMKQIIQDFKEYYELNEDNIEIFLTKIKEYNKSNNIEEEEIIENNDVKDNENINSDNWGNLNINEINDNINTEEEKKSNSTEANSQI